VSRRVALMAGLLAAGYALSAATSRADDCSFAFFRRCPPDSGVQDGVVGYIKSFCRPPRCPPYCDPTFGYYPTMWRSWPTLYCGAMDELPTSTTPGTQPSTTPGGTTPRVMPPASDEANRRLQGYPGTLTPTARTPAELPNFNGASGR
jgi:hypothetical protein